MTRPKPFNYAAFKERWLAGCKKYHIDPETGPTTFTICNLRADQVKAQKMKEAIHAPAPETSEVLEAWLALGRWAWGVDLVEWGLIRSVLTTAIRIAKPREVHSNPTEAADIDPDLVSLIDFFELWHEVRIELMEELTPQQREILPSWSEINPLNMLVLAS